MQDLRNKLFIYVAGGCIIWYLGVDRGGVVAFTLSLAMSCLCSYVTCDRVRSILVMIYAFSCLFAPPFAVYLPLLFYDAFYHRLKIPMVFSVFTGLFSLFYLPTTLICPFYLLFTGTYFLADDSKKNQSLLYQLHQIRDQSAEAEIHLKKLNKAQIDKQNSEIHAATLSERNRIAREIHDNVGHMLTRSILQTGALKVINQDPTLSEPLETLSDTLNTAMTSIRTSVHDLHDDSIDLYSILNEIATGDPTLCIHLEYDVAKELPRDLKYAFISIVKEAVNNIHKHSDADCCNIIVREHPGFYLLQIRDNGTSHREFRDTDGIGLSGIRDRVHSLGGTLHINTEQGFFINISIIKKHR